MAVPTLKNMTDRGIWTAELDRAKRLWRGQSSWRMAAGLVSGARLGGGQASMGLGGGRLALPAPATCLGPHCLFTMDGGGGGGGGGHQSSDTWRSGVSPSDKQRFEHTYDMHGIAMYFLTCICFTYSTPSLHTTPPHTTAGLPMAFLHSCRRISIAYGMVGSSCDVQNMLAAGIQLERVRQQAVCGETTTVTKRC